MQVIKARKLTALALAFVIGAAACSGDSSADTTISEVPAPTTSTASTASTLPTTCSAAGMDPVTEERSNIPDETEATRLALIEAALNCDFATLAELAAAGETPFAPDDATELPAAWVEREVAGDEPLRILVTLLRGTMGTVALETTEYRFPSAAGFGEWEAVPDQIRRTLEPLYTEADWAGFEAAGVYNGHRTAISDSGEWISFHLGG